MSQSDVNVTSTSTSTMQRHVTHLDFPAFLAAIEQAKHPDYRNRPVIVSSASSTRSVVLSASPEAKREGIYNGMLLKQALRQANGAIVVEPNPELYQRATQYILKRLESFSPFVEPIRFGHIAVDLTGTTRLFGRVKDTAYRIYKDMESSCHLKPSIGIAVNKLVSGIAAHYIQSYAELFDVLAGNEQQFLEPLDVKLLPGIGGAKENVLLEELNIRSIGELSEIPVNKLAIVFGRQAYGLHQAARGVDDSPVRPPATQPEIKEEYTFDDDTNHDEVLYGVAYYLIERGCLRLRQLGKKTNRVRLFCRYSDNQVSSRVLTFAEPLQEEYAIAQKLQQVFEGLFERRTRVRYLSVAFQQLQHSAEQIRLFEPELSINAYKQRQIIQALDRIRLRNGHKAIGFGTNYFLVEQEPRGNLILA